ncbi:MAG TPA: acyl-CoA thioesterase domain-containing protein [Acidimicrobiales bacterium]
MSTETGSGDGRDVLQVLPLGGDRYSVVNVGDPAERDVVFGGQVLAQSIVVAALRHPGKKVRTIQTVFARAARVSAALELSAETGHSGRSFASETVTALQDGRLCVRSLVLLDIDDSDVIRHSRAMPEVAGPEDSPPFGLVEKVFPGSELRVVGGIDTGDPDLATDAAELHLWTRTRGVPDDEVSNQAVLAYATNGFLVRTALLPHAGLGGNLVHTELSTSVLSHMITFHEPAHMDEWVLLANASPYAGRGRSYGEVDVFSRDGRLLATAVQQNMIRSFDGAKPSEEHARTLM